MLIMHTPHAQTHARYGDRSIIILDFILPQIFYWIIIYNFSLNFSYVEFKDPSRGSYALIKNGVLNYKASMNVGLLQCLNL